MEPNPYAVLMSFGSRLTEQRQAKGLTQAELGVGLGTDGAPASKSVVYGWEKDQHYPRVDQLMLICNRLGCSADYLLYGVASELPFSHELLIRINSMTADEIHRAENVMRAHLGMAHLEQVNQQSETMAGSQPHPQQDENRSNGQSDKKSQDRLINRLPIRGSDEVGQPGSVPKPRGGRRS